MINEAIQILSNLSKNALDVLLFLYFIRINPRHYLNRVKLSQKQSREFIGSIAIDMNYDLLDDSIDELKRKGLIFENATSYRIAQPDWIIDSQRIIKKKNYTQLLNEAIEEYLGFIGDIVFNDRSELDISKLGSFIIDNNLSNLKIPNYITDMLIKNKA